MLQPYADHPAASISDPAFAMWFWTLMAITAAGALAAVAESLALFGVLATLAAGSLFFAIGHLPTCGAFATRLAIVSPGSRRRRRTSRAGSRCGRFSSNGPSPESRRGNEVSSVPGRAPAVKLPPQVESGRDLLVDELGKLLTIETTLTKAVLPQLLREVQDEALKQAVQDHLAETRGHAGRVKEAFLALGVVPAGKPAYGLDGLRTEHDAMVPQVVPGARTAVHVAAAMGTEHYEINAYEAAIRLADALGAEEVGGLLRANLEQEIATLQKLGELADRIAKDTVEQRTVEGLL